MSCSEIQNLLSAYHDDELDSDIREKVAKHLVNCVSCVRELSLFEEVSQLAADLTPPVPPSNLWAELELRLQAETSQQEHVVSQSVAPARLRFLRKYSAFIVAATLLFAVGVGYLNQGDNSHNAHHHSSSVFSQYLTAFENDPDSAQQILLKNYTNDLVKSEQAARLLGYQPAIARDLPADYEIVASYVIKMPCCTCLQTVCRRKDGSQIVIFEHDDETTEWFDGQPKINATCGGEECCLVNLDERIAASWKRGKRHITVIGIRDITEVNELIAWSDQSRNKS